MKYNITGLDRELTKNFNSLESKHLKETLKVKIAEQEAMLDLFNQSITHCNQQVGFCTNKIIEENDTLKKQEYEAQSYFRGQQTNLEYLRFYYLDFY